MKRLLCVVLCIVMVLFLVGAKSEQSYPLKIWGQNNNGCYYTLVVVDEETGVNYVVVSAENKSYSTSTIAISPRYNSDGSLYVSR